MPSYTVTKPSWFSSKQELREHDRVIGELTMLKKMSYALAEASMPGQTVRFGYKGWSGRSLFVQDAEGKDIADIKNLSRWKRDVAVTIDGKEYAWKQKDFWGMRHGWYAQDDKEIMEFRSHCWSPTDISQQVQPDTTTLTLLFLGMYLMKLQEMDGAAAGGY